MNKCTSKNEYTRVMIALVFLIVFTYFSVTIGTNGDSVEQSTRAMPLCFGFIAGILFLNILTPRNE